MERWLNVKIYAGHSLCQAVEFTEQYVVKPFLPSLSCEIAVDGVDSIMEYLKEVFWRRCCSTNIPSTLSNQFQYANDIAHQHELFSDSEVNQYFHRWLLQPNPNKTVSCVFHLSTHHANRTQDIQFAATQIQHVVHPKYLGVTLDQSLTYTVYKQVAAHVNLVRKLTGTN
jgi:hypothetical protein